MNRIYRKDLMMSKFFVSDHAVMRYIERIAAIDLDDLREKHDNNEHEIIKELKKEYDIDALKGNIIPESLEAKAEFFRSCILFSKGWWYVFHHMTLVTIYEKKPY